MKTVGIVANTEKLDAARVLREAVQLCRRADFRVRIETETAHLLPKRPASSPLKKLAAECDLLVVLGGDGTILRVARDLQGKSIPILGVNLGSLGFLTAVSQKDMREAIAKIRSGKYRVTQRSMLDARVLRDGKPISTHRALNDVVITRGAFSRLVRIEVKVDAELLTTYTCDGLIVATPTGSTAYSLSAGGPIIVPGAPALVITPICPHALTNRSLIVGPQSVVSATLLPQPMRVRSNDPIECLVAMDGQEQVPLCPRDTVEARQSASQLSMIVLPGHSHFEVLRHKLHWSGSNV